MVKRLNSLLEEARQLCSASSPNIQALGTLLSHIPAADSADEQLAGIRVLWSYIREALEPNVFHQVHHWAWCRLLLPHALWSNAAWWEAPTTRGNPHEIRLRDLSATDLRGAGLSWAELPGVQLNRTDLRGADMRGANLREASLRHANLEGAQMQGAWLPLSASSLLPQGDSIDNRDDEVSYSLQGASLSVAMDGELELEGTELSQTNLRGADLSGACLVQVDMRGANLQEANLRRADLSGADLRGADLSSADLFEARLTTVDLRGANLFWANLKQADLRHARATGANFEGASLEEADVRSADLSHTDLRGATLRGCRSNSDTHWPQGNDDDDVR
ncbi:MAG: pentapeptide repeat-containing protein [Myxococcota bacterium]